MYSRKVEEFSRLEDRLHRDLRLEGDLGVIFERAFWL